MSSSGTGILLRRGGKRTGAGSYADNGMVYNLFYESGLGALGNPIKLRVPSAEEHDSI